MSVTIQDFYVLIYERGVYACDEKVFGANKTYLLENAMLFTKEEVSQYQKHMAYSIFQVINDPLRPHRLLNEPHARKLEGK